MMPSDIFRLETQIVELKFMVKKLVIGLEKERRPFTKLNLKEIEGLIDEALKLCRKG